MEHDGSSFLCGYAAFFDFLFFAKEADDLAKDDIENSSFFLFGQPDWMKYDFDAAWTAVAMASMKRGDEERLAVAISSHGSYWEVKPVSLTKDDGLIDCFTYPLRSLATIDQSIYACGMGRSVLQRLSLGKWEEIGPGTTERDGDEIVGFEDIDGFNQSDIYAVGWGGEIWHFGKGRWKRLDSPTSNNLNALCCAADGHVYAVGDNGTVVVGRDDIWEVLELDIRETLQDVACYDGVIYVCTDFEILKLDGRLLVAEDNFEDEEDRPSTCMHLLAGEDAIFSMGPKDLFRMTDSVWERFV